MDLKKIEVLQLSGGGTKVVIFHNFFFQMDPSLNIRLNLEIKVLIGLS